MMNQKTLLPIVLVPSGILMIPAAAMLFKVEGWAWRAADFVVCWVVIAAAMTAYQLVASRAPNRTYRFGMGIAVTTGVILLWINGAVGLIGSEDNPANLMYVGVLALGLIGAAVTRLRPSGMVWTLGVMAVAQFLVPIIAFIWRRPDFTPGVVEVLVLNFGFVLLFVVSALLFQKAGSPSRRTAGGARCP